MGPSTESTIGTQCTICDHTVASAHEAASHSPSQSHVSQMNNLLQSNHAPLHAEEASLRNLREERTQQLNDLRDKIESARVQLTALVQQYAVTEQELFDYKAALNPVRRIPDDILCEIFSFFVPVDVDPDVADEDNLVSSTDQSTMPWRLSHVCSRWRSVTFSFHKLWSVIRLPPQDLDEASNKAAFLLGVQLHRSGSYPLSVSIASNKEIRPFNPILYVLLPTSPRWRRLEICTAFESFKSLNRIAAHFPSLTSLHFAVTSVTVVPGMNARQTIRQSPLASMFQACPALRQLRGQSGVLADCGPWEHITSYDSVIGTSRDHLNVLRLMPNIQFCTLQIDEQGSHQRSVLAKPSVTLQHLKELLLRCASNSGPLILKRLVLPSLHVISVVSDVALEIERNQFPRLDIAVLHLPKIKDSDCIRILRNLPSVKTLGLRCPNAYTPFFFEHLICTVATLPALQQLNVYEAGSSISSPLFERLKAARSGLQVVPK